MKKETKIEMERKKERQKESRENTIKCKIEKIEKDQIR